MATRDGRSQGGKSAPVAEPDAAVVSHDGGSERLDARELLRVLSSFRRGDFSVRLAADATGVSGRIADTLNDILDLCERSAKEYERVSRAVGKDGRTNQRANLGAVTGGWAAMAESMNSLIGDLVQPSTEIARVITAVAKGDLTQSMPLEVEGRSLKGEFLRSARVVNTMVEQLNSFASEVTRVAREVGTEGKLGGQAKVKGVAGTWKDLTESVNSMASNLTSQVRNIAQVTTAVARGDLTTKITVDARGEILELKNTINTMVDQLSSFAGEVTRVAREVGTDGKLGGQADVKGVAGVWKELTENVNLMAGNLTNQVRNIAQVTTAVANGDLSTKITVEARGEFLELKNTINVMVDQLNAFAGEVTRVAREVGTDGKLGGQAEVKGVGGVWKDLTDSVNFMAGNLTAQVRNIADVTTAVANGDLSKKITVDVRGEILELKNTINTMVDQLNAFAGEVTRVAREVGTEGKLGGQAEVKGVGGVWKDLTDNVNSMARNLTNQVRNIAEVTTAVARGDLSTKITVDARGEILELKNTINTMVDQLNAFAGEVTRVAREVGTEGKLGGQADVRGIGGVWKDLTDSVNSMAGNLTNQVRNIAHVTTAVANGDLSRKITVDARGEILALKDTINTMVDQLNAFASEVTRVAREVGTDGKLGGQAVVKGVAGTWKDLTDSVNFMASNLTNQVRNIAEVTTAVATGDLSKKITVDVRGEILELKNTINTMVDQLNAFAGEVTRVAREVGTEGKLGGQAVVKDVAGTWKDLTDNVNSMASNLTNQVRNIAEVTTAVANGDLSKKITVDARGEILELKNTINTMVDQLNAFAGEVTRVAREVGTEGKLGGQAEVKGVAGTWKDLTDSVNRMAGNLTAQVRNIADVTTAVAKGDLSKKITVDVRGEILELKNTINTMVDQLNAFAGEVTRVAREVGTEGKLGGQADVRGVAGTWKDLTDSVNSMASNLTNQVRNIAQVTTAVAMGDLSRKITVDVRGEILELKNTINTMVDQLNAFASEVTRVAREVGVEGKLGGQARVPGAAGIWRDLTNNVNQLAANLTTQVRAIAEVATAVTKGDLTRSIAVEVQGELAALKDNINEMILNLRETTQRNTEQDWLKTNVARFTGMLQGQRDLLTVARRVLSELAPLVNAQHGVFYMNEATDGSDPLLKLIASYAYKDRKGLSHQFRAGEGLVGQCALEKQRIRITDVPPDYIQISSGLGEASPSDIVVLPVLFEGEVKAVIELASFKHFSDVHIAFLEQLTENMGIVLNTIQATMRTEELLKQSQALAEELQSQQKELREGNKRLEEQARTLQKSEELLKKQQDDLQRANLELQEKARLLVEQNEEVERKNREVEQARKALEEKAEQLALTSRYKSEFLANMSHELRTPLNSLLILAQMLAENFEGKLTPKQVKFAQTIHQSGIELLSLINDILDLSKIESGMMGVEFDQVFLTDVQHQAVRTFRHIAEQKGLDLNTEIAPGAPKTIYTDPRRLQQVIKNLLSNAVKFTDHGSVTLKIERATSGWSRGHAVLDKTDSVIAFRVIDTGIGIPEDQQHVIFEPFRQADSGPNRQYGGTGLGLSISRELANLLGGEIRVKSRVGEGSEFTLYLPANYVPPPQNGRTQPRGESQHPAVRSEAPRPQIMTQGAAEAMAVAEPPVTAAALQPIDIVDDRESIQPGDEVLLIVEDDPTFARILVDLAHERKLKVVIAPNGAKGLMLAKELAPGAISLDIRLPDMAGWTIIDRLKHDPVTRHIPIHVISIDEDRRRGLSLGAASYMEKGIDMRGLVEVFDRIKQSIELPARNLLIVEGDEAHQRRLAELIDAGDVHTTFLASGEEALNVLHHTRFDCIVVDLTLADMSGIEFVKRLQQQREGKETPVLVYTGENPSPEVEDAVKRLAQTGLVRGIRSAEKLLEDTAIFLHRVESALPEEKRRLLEQAREKKESAIAGGKVLLVDDDVRNLFALTSVLERHKLRVLHAESGQEAIEHIKNEPDIDLVLMDIMMPKMDGYETIRRIRQMPGAHNLPIVALTAKAMKGDREKCIEAGASDYITKPVNLDDLIWMLRAWLPRVSEGA